MADTKRGEEPEDEFSDDAIDDLPLDDLLALEQNAYAAMARQSQSAPAAIPRSQAHTLPAVSHRPELLGQQAALTSSSYSLARPGPAVLTGPRGRHGQGLSFGEAEIRNLDAGVLDDGATPAPVEQQAVVMMDQGDSYTEKGDGREEQQTLEPNPSFSRRKTYGIHDPFAVSRSAAAGTEGSYVNERGNDGPSAAATAADDEAQAIAEAERLREQVEQLARDREAIFQELSATKSTAEARAGEIAIIRANQAKMQRTHEEQLAALRAAMNEQLHKHKAEIEATAMESKRVTTENAFLKQDLREEALRVEMRERAWRAKEKRRERSVGTEGGQRPPMTPRKERKLPFRDGFDDDEIMASPSKSGRRSGRGTPSARGKRKRKVVDDSPRPLELQLSQTFEDNHNDNTNDEAEGEEGSVVLGGGRGAWPFPRLGKAPLREDRNVRFMRAILNHRTHPNKLRDLELLASMSFPSQPDRAFSSYVLEATASSPAALPSVDPSATCRPPSHPAAYAVSYAKAIISLWSRALAEHYYAPVSTFMAIIKFILELDTPLLAPPLIPDLVPVLHDTAYTNGLARFQNSPNWHLNRGQVKQTPQRDLKPELNGTEALELLYLMATSGCMHARPAHADGGDCGDDQVAVTSATPFVEFWTRIPYRFVLMMLNAHQPIRDIVLTLNLLSCSLQQQTTTFATATGVGGSTSNNPTITTGIVMNKAYTFGPIHTTEAEQALNEKYIIDRAANLLSEVPFVDEGLPPCTTRDVTGLRLEIMYFLNEVAFSSVPPARTTGAGTVEAVGGNGLALLSSHPTALARIFRSMHDELDALYAAHAEDDRAMHAELVNGLTRLAYGVLHGPPSVVGSGSPALNLHAVPGAVQKHLVVLTRLAFSERGAAAPRQSSMENAEDKSSGSRNDTGPVNVLLEAGIDLETVEMAHEMLEEAVNPQEAEALVEVFRPELVGAMVEEDLDDA